MSAQDESPDKAKVETSDLRQQFPALSEMLRALNRARRQSSMYGPEHPNAEKAIAALTECMEALVAEIGSATCVFTENFIIVNDHQYVATDAHELYLRLRVRGVLGVTFLGGQSVEQVMAFLDFLNATPAQVKRDGGPSKHLRKHGVSRIIVTEQVHRIESDDGLLERAAPGTTNIDRSLGRALEWLLRQREESEEEPAPILPIAEILADPDATSKLIREAVTKLHRSRRPKPTMNTLTHEVVSGLKDLTGSDQEAWDNAAPQVRKAVSKLPKEMRPTDGGFLAGSQTDEEKKLGRAWRYADVAEVEALIGEAMQRSSGGEAAIGAEPPQLQDIQDYFSTMPRGIMSAWQDELHPAVTTASAASTFGMLLQWEQSAAEHSRISSALAALVKRSVEADDLGAAARCAGELADEASQPDRLSWRATNARMALQALEPSALVAVAKHALDPQSSCTPALAAALVEACPSVGLGMAEMLGVAGDAQFTEALKGALSRSGAAGVACLGKLLRQGKPAQAQMALDVLAQIRDSRALTEIADVVRWADDGLVISALKVIPKLTLAGVSDTVQGLLSHKSLDVRCAALDALGRMGSPSVLPLLFRIARFRLFPAPDVAEQLAAIQAMGMILDEQSRGLLQSIAKRSPLLGRAKAAKLRAAAAEALAQMPELEAGEIAAAA